MSNLFSFYKNLIVTERDWSWTLIAIAAFIAALIIRGWFMKPLTSQAKKLGHMQYQSIKAIYDQNALWGWIFLLTAVGDAAYIWTKPVHFPLTPKDLLLLGGILFGILLAVLFHLMAFGNAVLKTLKQFEEEQKIL